MPSNSQWIGSGAAPCLHLPPDIPHYPQTPSATWKCDIPFSIIVIQSVFHAASAGRTQDRPIEFIHSNFSVGKPPGMSILPTYMYIFFPRFCARPLGVDILLPIVDDRLTFLEPGLGCSSPSFQRRTGSPQNEPTPPLVAQLEVFSTMDSTFERQKLCKSIW